MSFSLELRLARGVFKAGEPIEAELALRNEGEEPAPMHLPADPGHPRLRIRIEGGAEAIELGGGEDAGPPVEVGPGEVLRGTLSIGKGAPLPPGRYTLRALLAGEGAQTSSEVSSEALPFAVFAPERAALALPAGRLEVAAPWTSLLTAELGTEAGLLIERRLEPHIEHSRWYELGSPQRTLVPPRVPDALIEVAAAEEGSAGWVAWVDGQGLCACTRDASVRGLWELPLEAPAMALGPALERADGGLSLFVVRGDEPELIECRFAPPATEIEEAEGPDDWDDTILVPGPIEVRSLGPLPFAPERGVVTETDEGARVALAAAAEEGVRIWHGELGDGPGGALRSSATQLFETARLVPDATLALTLDAEGGRALHLLFQRPKQGRDAEGRPVGDERYAELYLGTLRIDGDKAEEPTERGLGLLPAPLRSAAMVRSRLRAEPGSFLFAVLDAEGGVLHGQRSGRQRFGGLARASLPAPPLVPLALGGSEERAYLCVETALGPLPVPLS